MASLELDLLLDTQVFIWWRNSEQPLREGTRLAIADPANRILVSAVAAWEIAVKRRAHKLVFTGSPIEAIRQNHFFPIAIEPEDGEFAGDLDWDHKDPFDRILVAQAMRRGITLVSADAKIRNGPASVLWAG
jgi:PIN domain nuclease of toxin-antitoxin system